MIPPWYGAPDALAASTRALTTSSEATAGYSVGTYPFGVPSLRTDPSAITRSPILISGCAAPHVPTRRKVCTPSSLSSSTPIATDGPPIPVDIVEPRTPPFASPTSYFFVPAAGMRRILIGLRNSVPVDPGENVGRTRDLGRTEA